MAAYLEACIEVAGGNAAFIAKALDDIACCNGMTEVARRTGLSGERSPSCDAVMKVIAALGLEPHATHGGAANASSNKGNAPDASKHLGSAPLERTAMSLAPNNLSEAAQDLATGDFGDLAPGEILLEFAPYFQPPYVVAGIGLAMGILCGLTFAKLVQNKLDGWKQDRLALLPLGNLETNLPYAGVIVGITLFIGGSL